MSHQNQPVRPQTTHRIYGLDRRTLGHSIPASEMDTDDAMPFPSSQPVYMHRRSSRSACELSQLNPCRHAGPSRGAGSSRGSLDLPSSSQPQFGDEYAYSQSPPLDYDSQPPLYPFVNDTRYGSFSQSSFTQPHPSSRSDRVPKTPLRSEYHPSPSPSFHASQGPDSHDSGELLASLHTPPRPMSQTLSQSLHHRNTQLSPPPATPAQSRPVLPQGSLEQLAVRAAQSGQAYQQSAMYLHPALYDLGGPPATSTSWTSQAPAKVPIQAPRIDAAPGSQTTSFCGPKSSSRLNATSNHSSTVPKSAVPSKSGPEPATQPRQRRRFQGRPELAQLMALSAGLPSTSTSAKPAEGTDPARTRRIKRFQPPVPRKAPSDQQEQHNPSPTTAPTTPIAPAAPLLTMAQTLRQEEPLEAQAQQPSLPAGQPAVTANLAHSTEVPAAPPQQRVLSALAPSSTPAPKPNTEQIVKRVDAEPGGSQINNQALVSTKGSSLLTSTVEGLCTAPSRSPSRAAHIVSLDPLTAHLNAGRPQASTLTGSGSTGPPSVTTAHSSAQTTEAPVIGTPAVGGIDLAPTVNPSPAHSIPPIATSLTSCVAAPPTAKGHTADEASTLAALSEPRPVASCAAPNTPPIANVVTTTPASSLVPTNCAAPISNHAALALNTCTALNRCGRSFSPTVLSDSSSAREKNSVTSKSRLATSPSPGPTLSSESTTVPHFSVPALTSPLGLQAPTASNFPTQLQFNFMGTATLDSVARTVYHNRLMANDIERNTLSPFQPTATISHALMPTHSMTSTQGSAQQTMPEASPTSNTVEFVLDQSSAGSDKGELKRKAPRTASESKKPRKKKVSAQDGLNGSQAQAAPPVFSTTPHPRTLPVQTTPTVPAAPVATVTSALALTIVETATASAVVAPALTIPTVNPSPIKDTISAAALPGQPAVTSAPTTTNPLEATTSTLSPAAIPAPATTQTAGAVDTAPTESPSTDSTVLASAQTVRGTNV